MHGLQADVRLSRMTRPLTSRANILQHERRQTLETRCWGFLPFTETHIWALVPRTMHQAPANVGFAGIIHALCLISLLLLRHTRQDCRILESEGSLSRFHQGRDWVIGIILVFQKRAACVAEGSPVGRCQVASHLCTEGQRAVHSGAPQMSSPPVAMGGRDVPAQAVLAALLGCLACGRCPVGTALVGS